MSATTSNVHAHGILNEFVVLAPETRPLAVKFWDDFMKRAMILK